MSLIDEIRSRFNCIELNTEWPEDDSDRLELFISKLTQIYPYLVSLYGLRFRSSTCTFTTELTHNLITKEFLKWVKGFHLANTHNKVLDTNLHCLCLTCCGGSQSVYSGLLEAITPKATTQKSLANDHVFKTLNCKPNCHGYMIFLKEFLVPATIVVDKEHDRIMLLRDYKKNKPKPQIATATTATTNYINVNIYPNE